MGEKDGEGEARRIQLGYLRRRTLALEIAVALGTLAAICTGCAILNLLAGALEFGFREENLFWFFGGAIVSLICSLVAFLFEILIAGRNMLRQMRMDRWISRVSSAIELRETAEIRQMESALRRFREAPFFKLADPSVVSAFGYTRSDTGYVSEEEQLEGSEP